MLEPLRAQDFSATTALYSIAANMRAFNPFVLDARIIIIVMLATATLVPSTLRFGGRRPPLPDVHSHRARAWVTILRIRYGTAGTA